MSRPDRGGTRLAASTVLARSAAAIAFLVGVAVVAGWILDVEFLARGSPGLAAMNVKTALCFILTGVGFLPASPDGRSRTRAALVSSLLVIGFCLLTLGEYAFGWNLGIDHILSRELVTPAARHPGRMAPNSALGLALLNGALILRLGPARRARLTWAVLLAALAVSLGSIALAGYLGRVTVGYSWGDLTTMSVPTGATLVLLGAACVVLAWQEADFELAVGGRLLAGFLAALALFLGMGVASYRSAQKLSAAEAALRTTAERLVVVATVRADIANLVPSPEGRVAATGALAAPELERDVERLRSVDVDGRVPLLAAMASGRRAGPLRALLADMEQRERERLAASEAVTAALTARTFLILPIGTFVGLGALLTVMLFLNTETAERRRAETTGRDAAAVVASTEDAVITKTLDGIIRTWNPGAERIFGYSIAEAVGMPIATLIPAQRASEASDILDRIGGGQHVNHFETVRVRKDGRFIDVSVTVSPVTDESGRVVGASKIVRDITERKSAAEALERLGARLTTTLESMNVAFLTVDRDWRFTYINREGERLVQRRRQELLGRNLWEEFKEATGGPSDVNYRLAMSENLAVEFEEFYAPLGRWFDVSAYPSSEGLAIYFRDVTDKKQAAARLRESEERFLAAFHLSPAAIAIARRDDRCVLEVNDAFLRLFGCTRDEIVGHTFADLGLLDAAMLESLAAQVTAEGGVDNAEVAGHDRHGRALHVGLSVRVVELRGRACSLATLVDITERKRVEAERDELARQRQLALTAARLGWWHYDPAMRQVAWDDRFREIFGVTELSRGSLDILERVHPDDVPRLSAAVQAALDPARAEAYEMEYRLKGPAGSERWVEAHGVATFEGTGADRRATSLVGTVEDVTERKRAERRLAMQHAVTGVLADAMSLPEAAPAIIQAVCLALGGRFGAIWEMDQKRAELRCADVWRAPGLDADPLEAETRAITFPPGFGLPGRVWASGRPMVVDDIAHDPVFARARTAAAAGLKAALAFPVLRRTEVVGVVDVLGPYLEEPEPGLLAALSAIGSQIGQFIEHRRADQQLLQAQKMEAVGQLAGGIAHDFNNLLGVILGYAELAAREIGPQHKARGRIDALVKAADRAAALTRQILTFSRKQAVELRVCDLNDVVENMEKMLRRVIGEDVRLAVALAPDLGRVRADRGQLEQVIMNLAVNARDAMPSGGRLVIETANVDLDAHYAERHPDVKPGPYVMLAASDTGEGMTPATQARIFEPFFTTKDPGKGTGLGLAVVFGVVNQSQGSISVYSEPGRGSTFKVFLPRAYESGEVRVEDAPAAEAPGGSETILVVEDEDALRAIVVELLRDAGYTVLEAGDPVAAAVVAAESGLTIDLLLSDMVMPGQSGHEVATTIAGLRPGIRVILMSGYTDRQIGGTSPMPVRTPFLGKPFTRDALLLKVRAVLDGKA